MLRGIIYLPIVVRQSDFFLQRRISKNPIVVLTRFFPLPPQVRLQVVPTPLQGLVRHRHRRLRDHDGHLHGPLPLLRRQAARLDGRRHPTHVLRALLRSHGQGLRRDLRGEDGR